MIEDMRVRDFSLATQRGYIRAVKMLAAFLGRSPDTATAEELRTFQRHLAAKGFTPACDQHDRVGAAVLLPLHRRQAGDDAAPRLHPRAAEAAARALVGTDRPAAGGCIGAEGQGDAERRLWRRIARHGGRCAQGLRHRQQADAAPRRQRQGRQGPLRHALADAARSAARLVPLSLVRRSSCSPAATRSDR